MVAEVTGWLSQKGNFFTTENEAKKCDEAQYIKEGVKGCISDVYGFDFEKFFQMLNDDEHFVDACINYKEYSSEE